jgi:hypothetical protein
MILLKESLVYQKTLRLHLDREFTSFDTSKLLLLCYQSINLWVRVPCHTSDVPLDNTPMLLGFLEVSELNEGGTDPYIGLFLIMANKGGTVSELYKLLELCNTQYVIVVHIHSHV